MSVLASQTTTTFEVHVTKDTFKFNAAHFVAYPGFRERLHGHNYRVGVTLLGSRKIGSDGYLIDFGCVKDVTKRICKELNEHFLCPTLSTVMTIDVGIPPFEQSVRLTCEDGSVFVFPKQDCAMLPIAHATTEELAIYLWGKILEGLDADYLLKRGIHTMTVNVSESVGQDATFRMHIPAQDHTNAANLVDVASYISEGGIVPRPCLFPSRKHTHETEYAKCGPDCSKSELSNKLEKLATVLNCRPLGDSSRDLTAKDLEAMLS